VIKMSKREKLRRFQRHLEPEYLSAFWIIFFGFVLLGICCGLTEVAKVAGYYPPPRTPTPPETPKIYDLKFGKIYTIESCKIRTYVWLERDYYITVRDEDGNRYVLFLDELPQGFIAAVPGDKIMRTSTNIIKVP